MKVVNYINREYVNPIDLNILDKTYSTLEQGHKEAVKAASDLQVAMANLDLNEAESEWRQNKIDEIRQTIDNNTIYGNSAAALDDLILKAGDLTADQGLIGRLQAQKDYKEFQAKVDKMAIPEGMKAMYKEINPYGIYEDKYDNNGRIIGGTKWKPNKTPVNSIPESEIQKYALQIAAKEHGKYNNISFLDANGKATSDPTKSVDGAMYMNNGVSYTRLPKDKIKRAYEIAINSIPGAADSIRQDYDYQKYEYNKLDKSGNNPYIEGFTDKAGNIYTFDKWLDNKINGFASIATYNYVESNTDVGTALQNYRKLQTNKNYGIGTKDGGVNSGIGTILSGRKEVEGDALAGVEDTLNAANKQGIDILKKVKYKGIESMNNISDVIQDLIKDKKATGPGSAANYIVSNYGKNLNTEDRLRLNNSIMGYYRANTQKQQMINAAGEEADGLRFSAAIYNNNFTGNDKYSKQITKGLNIIYGNRDSVKYEIGNALMDNIFKAYNSDIYGLRKQGIIINKQDDGNYMVEIDADHRNLLPTFVYNLRESDKRTNSSAWGWFKKEFLSGVGAGNYHEYNSGIDLQAQRPSVQSHGGSITDNLYHNYKDGLEAGAKAENKVGVSKGFVSFNSADDASFGALYYRDNASALGLSETELQNAIERQNKQVDNSFAQGWFDAGRIEELDKAGNALPNIESAQDAKILIQKMYSDSSFRNKISRSVMIPTGAGIGQPKGYILSFDVPKGVEVGKYKEGEHIQFIVSGIKEEEINYDPSFNPAILANNAIQTSKATNSNIENFGYDSNLGNTRLTIKDNGNYITNFMGVDKEIDSEQAKDFSACLYRLEQIKPAYLRGEYNTSTEHLQQLGNTLQSIANTLGSIVGKNPDNVLLGIVNYMQTLE